MGSTYEYWSLNPAEAQDEQSSSYSWARECAACWVLISVVGIVASFFLLADQAFGQVPHYSVAIDHVSGLNPTVTDLVGHRQTLALDFSLTLRVASWGVWATVCAEPRMYAVVSYRGASLAASATLTQQICAEPMEAVEHHLLARGAGVVVPGSTLGSLAMEMRGGVQVFDVALRGRRMERDLSCGPIRVGDVTGSKCC